MLARLKSYVCFIRPHHWIKNGFVLVPAFFGGQLGNAASWNTVGAAFLLFCFLSSAVYIFNDLVDRAADGRHAKKRSRPLPAGEIGRTGAIGLLVLLLLAAAGLLLSMKPPPAFTGIVLLYAVTNMLYSLGLKQVPVLELFLLASNYMYRLAAGAVIAHESLTGWIIVTTGLIALLMAAGKRRGDLVQANDREGARKSLSGYNTAYLDQIIAMLAAATVVTYLLFCISDYAQTRFGPHVMWSSVFVLYGIMRYMQILTVENGGDSPTALVYRDKPMVITVALFTLFFALNIYFLR